MKYLPQLKLHTVLAVLLALMTAGGVVYAAIPDTSGLIYGCYLNRTGALRVIDKAAIDPADRECNASRETPIQWNQTGPQGLQGPQGPQGLQGPQGSTGLQGPSGIVTAQSVVGDAPVPSTTRQFLAPTVTVSVATGQKVHVTSSRALGTTAAGGAHGLQLYICAQSTAAGAPFVVPTGSYVQVDAVAGSRAPMGLSGVFGGLAPGQYKFALCGETTGNQNWNFNEWGSTSVLVMTTTQ